MTWHNAPLFEGALDPKWNGARTPIAQSAFLKITFRQKKTRKQGTLHRFPCRIKKNQTHTAEKHERTQPIGTKNEESGEKPAREEEKKPRNARKKRRPPRH